MENTDWRGALRKMQPTTPGGAQSAGSPGMGAGAVPYAPGMTQIRPNTGPPAGGGPPAQAQGNISGGGMAVGQNAPSPQGGQGHVGQWHCCSLG